MILHFLSPLILVSSVFASRHGNWQYRHRRAQENPNPTVGGYPDGGWEEFPDVVDATAYPNWVVNEELDAKLPVYQTTGLDESVVKRAVIILPGKPRDCWYYWNVMNNALYVAAENDTNIKRDEISILGPCFFNSNDLDAGAAQEGQLIWGDTTWVSGHYNVGPSSIGKYSSFDVVDELVSYYMDRDKYPNLDVVVVAGHSAGAQMAQRYAGMRSSTTNDDRLHFWVANPGSIMWLVEDRPAPNDTCSGVDEYKYGLGGEFPGYATADSNDLGRSGLQERYLSRNIHYAWGLEDNGPGDTRCEAVTQGSTHLERGQNFVQMLEVFGGIPQNQTVDWVPGASHDNVEMMNSAEGGDKLFRFT